MAKIRSKENTEQEINRGKATGLWIRTGLAQKGWKIVDLAAAIHRNEGYLGVIANRAGINSKGAYQRVSEEIIDEIASALELDPADGRRAAGYADDTSPKPQSAFSYNIGEFNGKPVVVTLGDPLTEEQLQKMRFATSLTLAKFGGS